jgi:hypothetical protein
MAVVFEREQLNYFNCDWCEKKILSRGNIARDKRPAQGNKALLADAATSVKGTQKHNPP